MRRGIALGLVVGLAVLTVGASVSQATFPGENGRILTTTDIITCRDCHPVPILRSFNPDGSQPAMFPGADIFAGVYSPDGTKVAFIGPTGKYAGTYVVTVSAPDGSGQQQLLTTAALITNPLALFEQRARLSWLPDGKHLTYTGPQGTLWETDLNGLNQPVLPGKYDIYSATVSPNGEQVAYVSADQSTLYVAGFPLGLDAHPIASYAPGSIVSDPRWSPDSKQLIFSNGQVIEMSASGANARVVGSGSSATWSPDGKLIAFSGPTFRGHVIANADGSNPQTFPEYVGGSTDWQAVP